MIFDDFQRFLTKKSVIIIIIKFKYVNAVSIYLIKSKIRL